MQSTNKEVVFEAITFVGNLSSIEGTENLIIELVRPILDVAHHGNSDYVKTASIESISKISKHQIKSQ
jgi:hypothetical protein